MRSKGQVAEAEEEVGGGLLAVVLSVGEDKVAPALWRAPVAKMW